MAHASAGQSVAYLSPPGMPACSVRQYTPPTIADTTEPTAAQSATSSALELPESVLTIATPLTAVGLLCALHKSHRCWKVGIVWPNVLQCWVLDAGLVQFHAPASSRTRGQSRYGSGL